MHEHELTPEQLARIKDAEAALARHVERVDVDMPTAMARLPGETSSQTLISETESVVDVEFDADAMLHALEGLPDKAGTDAFVAAYARIKETEVALMRHIARIDVDMPSALMTLRGAEATERIPEMEFMLEVLRTLEGLSDGAGTDAFVAAYNARTDG